MQGQEYFPGELHSRKIFLAYPCIFLAYDYFYFYEVRGYVCRKLVVFLAKGLLISGSPVRARDGAPIERLLACLEVLFFTTLKISGLCMNVV